MGADITRVPIMLLLTKPLDLLALPTKIQYKSLGQDPGKSLARVYAAHICIYNVTNFCKRVESSQLIFECNLL